MFVAHGDKLLKNYFKRPLGQSTCKRSLYSHSAENSVLYISEQNTRIIIYEYEEDEAAAAEAAPKVGTFFSVRHSICLCGEPTNKK